ncbi:MAG: SRPBCC family protein [Bacteroidota bacterium]|jgi:mxaD protein
MKKIIIGIFLTCVSFSALAHGPSPQKVEKSITINASPDKVWAIVKDFGSFQKWEPLVTDIKLEKKGEDTLRTLTLKSGGKVIERLKGIDEEAMKLKYEIVEGSVPVADYNSFIVVTKGSNPNESNVTWVGRFYRVYKLNPPIPAGQDDESALKAVNEIYDAGLPALKKLAESK